MGRRRGDPIEQKELGYPGKRRTKTDRLIAEAQQRAELLASAPALSADVLAPPAFIDDPQLADALWIWQRYAKQLHANNLFVDVDRLSFAMFCVYQAEFFQADADIRKRGYYFMVATSTSNGREKRPWTNPSVNRREAAASWVLELSKRFGLTPLDRAMIERRHANFDDTPLGGGRRGEDEGDTPAPAEPAAPPGDDGSAIGLLGRLDSPPPRSKMS